MKHNINLKKPNWRLVICNLEASDQAISDRLKARGVKYSSVSINALRHGRNTSPGYEVGHALLNMLSDDHTKKTGRVSPVVSETYTR